MTKFQRERQKFTDAAKEAGEKADAEADKIVDRGVSIAQKLKDTKWTAAALLAGSLAAVYLIFK